MVSSITITIIVLSLSMKGLPYWWLYFSFHFSLIVIVFIGRCSIHSSGGTSDPSHNFMTIIQLDWQMSMSYSTNYYYYY